MNARKINLTLTVGLINSGTINNPLQAIKELMISLKEEVGAFLGLQPLGHNRLNEEHIQERYALRFEKCTLNVALVNNARASRQTIRSFELS